jgi:hypothetical protein
MPDNSYILFKDYSADYSKPLTVSDARADKIAQETVIATPEGETAKGSEKQEESISPTLNFED